MRIRLNIPADEQRNMKTLYSPALEPIPSPHVRASYADHRSVSGVLDGSI
jgi:hypothetical protein